MTRTNSICARGAKRISVSGPESLAQPLREFLHQRPAGRLAAHRAARLRERCARRIRWRAAASVSRRCGPSAPSSAARIACSCTSFVSLNCRLSSVARSMPEHQDAREHRERDHGDQQQDEAPEQRARQQPHARVRRRRCRGRAGGLAARRVGHVHVAESPHRLDVARIRGIGLDQLAQPRHLHVDRAVEDLVIAAARQHHQLLARERLARMLREHPQQREFAGGQRDARAVAVAACAPRGRACAGRTRSCLPRRARRARCARRAGAAPRGCARRARAD